MAVSIRVRVSGLDSLDACDELRVDLAEFTALSWTVEPPAEDTKGLDGIGETVLSAVVEGATPMALAYAVGKVREVLRRFSSEYVDPPETTVETLPAGAPDPDEG